MLAFSFIAALALILGACGYFNSLYNARKQFADAERQRHSGDVMTARHNYTASIEKAAKSFRRYPTGRWSDDALYLIGRARFHLGEYPAARAAFGELLARPLSGDILVGTRAYAGAAEAALANPAVALVYLDSAVVALGTDAQLSGFAHLWRARARAATGDFDAAWRDLDRVTSPADPEYATVQLERTTLAIAARDSARASRAFAGMLLRRDIRRSLDTLTALAQRASFVFGAPATRAMLDQPTSDLAAPARDSLAFLRARIAFIAGDTLNGNRELMQLAGRAVATTASAARVLVARARLLHINDLDGLDEIRTLLLPAIANADAQSLIRTMRLVDVLVQRSATTGQPLALFTAAEIARDELSAPLLARKLFVAYVDIAPQTPWAGKALLAAIAIDPLAESSNTLRMRLAALPVNPYTTVTRGESAVETYQAAEERLARSIIALRDEATQAAAQQETGVIRAIALLDSITVAARTDTLRLSCGMMLDTLSLKGMRADSVRTACMRRDATLIAAYLTIDTATWLPGFVPDTLKARQQRARRPTSKTIPKDSIK